MATVGAVKGASAEATSKTKGRTIVLACRDYPLTHLTAEQASLIKDALQKKAVDRIGAEVQLQRCRFRKEKGDMLIGCGSNYTQKWLYNIVPHLKLWEGCFLKMFIRKYMLKDSTHMYVGHFPETIPVRTVKILRRIRRQNKLFTAKWNIVGLKNIQSKIVLTFIVDAVSAKIIDDVLDRQLVYKSSTVQLRKISREELDSSTQANDEIEDDYESLEGSLDGTDESLDDSPDCSEKLSSVAPREECAKATDKLEKLNGAPPEDASPQAVDKKELVKDLPQNRNMNNSFSQNLPARKSTGNFTPNRSGFQNFFSLNSSGNFPQRGGGHYVQETVRNTSFPPNRSMGNWSGDGNFNGNWNMNRNFSGNWNGPRNPYGGSNFFAGTNFNGGGVDSRNWSNAGNFFGGGGNFSNEGNSFSRGNYFTGGGGGNCPFPSSPASGNNMYDRRPDQNQFYGNGNNSGNMPNYGRSGYGNPGNPNARFF